jgi:hypothetical protein
MRFPGTLAKKMNITVTASREMNAMAMPVMFPPDLSNPKTTQAPIKPAMTQTATKTIKTFVLSFKPLIRFIKTRPS